ncbi:MAG: hypothetical protein R2745_16290 [Vicinamibacterales bacterium]
MELTSTIGASAVTVRVSLRDATFRTNGTVRFWPSQGSPALPAIAVATWSSACTL